MRFLIGIFAVMLLLGCIGGGGEKPPIQENNSNQTNKTPPIKIIIGNQTNQTQGKNITKDPDQPPPPVNNELEYTNDPSKLLGVYFIDVGTAGEHGDAILIKKGDFDVLVDAGAEDQGNKVVDFLTAHEVDDIEVLISTSSDPRRYGGMKSVSNKFRIEELWWSGDTLGDATYSSIIKQISNKTKNTRLVEEGFTTYLDGINFTMLNPQKKRFNEVNNDAIVTRIADRNFSLLLTSGIQTGAQGVLLNDKKKLIATQIMQAPYYGVGAGTSNIGIFLVTAKPAAVVVTGSGDESAVNGGSREPFERLMKEYGIEYYKNYANGTIRVTTDGQDYSIMALGSGQ